MNATRHRRARSDATRNREAIIRATLMTLSEKPGASMEEIAGVAGVSRGTLYSHFPTRGALVGAVLRRVASQANATLAGLDPTLPPGDAVDALVGFSWRVLGDMACIWTAASGELSPRELTQLHQEPADRVRRLVTRGRRDGSFRTDQNLNWQVECIYAIIRAGTSLHITEEPARADLATVIVATVRAVLAAEPAASE